MKAWIILFSLLTLLSTSISRSQAESTRQLKQTTIVDDQLININGQLGPSLLLQNSGTNNLKYIGINLSGAEFGDVNDTIGSTYDYPTANDIQYFREHGINMVRLPIRWERMQPTNIGSSQFSDEIKYLDALIDYAVASKITVNFDIHNFCRYNGVIIGSNNSVGQEGYTTIDQYANFFGAFVARYNSKGPLVQYTVMNEPSEMETELWVTIANAAIAKARATGYTGILYINGNGWSGCYSWFRDFYGTPNSIAMLNITDPANNLAFDCHNYFNDDNSGNSPQCVNATIGVERVQQITGWLRQNKKVGILGEFGGALSPDCMTAVKNLLDFIQSNSDVWLGGAWWSAGPKWGNYYASLQPLKYDSAPKNQLVQLQHYVTRRYTGTL